MIVKINLHSSKESNCDRFYEAYAEKYGDDCPDDHPAFEKFCYALYEVTFELEVDETDGRYKILSITDGESIYKQI